MIKWWRIGLFAGMIVVFLAFLALIHLVEDQLLDSMVSTGPDITLDGWREQFRILATLGIGIAGGMAVLWFVLGQWVYSLNHWRDAEKRNLWLILFVLALLFGVGAGFILTPGAQEGRYWAIVFYLLNNFGVYYLATLLFSPSSYKYIPVGAMTVRHW